MRTVLGVLADGDSQLQGDDGDDGLAGRALLREWKQGRLVSVESVHRVVQRHKQNGTPGLRTEAGRTSTTASASRDTARVESNGPLVQLSSSLPHESSGDAAATPPPALGSLSRVHVDDAG